MFEVIKQVGNRRLIRTIDEDYDLNTLKGDTYNPIYNPDISLNKLKNEERLFERRVREEGVWGYEVQQWNPEIGRGWQFVEAAWGFVGDDFNGSGYDTDLLNKLNGGK